MDQVAERGALIHLPVGEKIFTPILTLFQSQKHSLYHIFHIHEGDVLLLVAHGEITMLLDALRHDEIVLFARTIDTSRS